MWRPRTILPILLFLHLGGIAHACEPIPFYEPIFPEFDKDDDIFVGRLIDYEVSKEQQHEVARLTYRVDEVLKGEFDETVQLIWAGQIHSGLPEKQIQTWEKEIVGARDTDPYAPMGPRTSLENDAVDGEIASPFSDGMRFLAVHPCSQAGELPATQKNVETVKNWIETKQKVPYGEIAWFDANRISVAARAQHDPQRIQDRVEEQLEQLPAMPALALWQWGIMGFLTLVLAGTSFLSWKARRS